MEVEGHRERESERCSLLALEAEGGATSQGIRWGALELGNRFSPGASRKKTTLLTHFRTSYLQNCNGINLCCFRSLFVVISYSSNRSLLYLHNTQGSLCPARSPLPPSRITLWSWIHVNPRQTEVRRVVHAWERMPWLSSNDSQREGAAQSGCNREQI